MVQELIIHKLIVDVPTANQARFKHYVSQPKSTHLCESHGAYQHCPEVTLFHVDSTMNEEDFDRWCYLRKGINYIGVVKREE